MDKYFEEEEKKIGESFKSPKKNPPNNYKRGLNKNTDETGINNTSNDKRVVVKVIDEKMMLHVMLKTKIK